MQACSSSFLPFEAALLKWAFRAMDIILHVGAHRTGTTSFQDYMYRKAPELESCKIRFWGPKETRNGLFSFLQTGPDASEKSQGNAVFRIQTALRDVEKKGIEKLFISDENMLGTVRQNINAERLYPNAVNRLQRVVSAIDCGISKVLISTRSLDTYWCSSFAYGVSRGVDLPSLQRVNAIACTQRSWRDVISDVAMAVPGADVRVLSFEAYRGRPDAYAMQGAEVVAPFDDQRQHLNGSADLPALRRYLQAQGKSSAALPFGMGRWNPFSNEQLAALRETYADDMMWLAAGADGKAKEIKDGSFDRAGKNLPRELKQKGQSDEFKERKMARPG